MVTSGESALHAVVSVICSRGIGGEQRSLPPVALNCRASVKACGQLKWNSNCGGRLLAVGDENNERSRREIACQHADMETANLTTEMKVCGVCGRDLLERDKYCRHCGIKRQTTSGLSTSAITVGGSTASPLVTQLPAASTSALLEADTYHRVSGPLMDAVAAGITPRASGKFHGQFVRHALSMLISIPIWLMIILLSPFDAYFAAKDISSQVSLK